MLLNGSGGPPFAVVNGTGGVITPVLPKYLLVGHSVGSLYTRRFAQVCREAFARVLWARSLSRCLRRCVLLVCD